MATEEINDSQATTIANSEITIEAENAPKQIELRSEIPVLRQRSFVKLGSFENKKQVNYLQIWMIRKTEVRIQLPQRFDA